MTERMKSVQERVAAYYDSEKTINFYRDFWDPTETRIEHFSKLFK